MTFFKRKQLWVNLGLLMLGTGLLLMCISMAMWAIGNPVRSILLFVLFMIGLGAASLCCIGMIAVSLVRLITMFAKTAPDVLRVIKLCKLLIDGHAAQNTLYLAEGTKWVNVALCGSIYGPVYNITVETRDRNCHEDDKGLQIRFATDFAAIEGTSQLSRNVRFINVTVPGKPGAVRTDELYKFYMFWAWHKRLPNRRRLENEFRLADKAQTAQLIELLRYAAVSQEIPLDG